MGFYEKLFLLSGKFNLFNSDWANWIIELSSLNSIHCKGSHPISKPIHKLVYLNCFKFNLGKSEISAIFIATYLIKRHLIKLN